MAKLDNNPNLLYHLDQNKPFLYAHLVKFERPYRLSSIIQENSNIQFSTKFTKYAYITDASFNISFDDGSTYLSSATTSVANGAQVYRANKLRSVGNISESADTKISNITISINASAVDANIPAQSITFNAANDSITATTDSFSDAGFQEGDLIKFIGAGTNSNKTFRINYFTSGGKTIYVTEDSDLVSTETASYSAVLASSEINALLNTTTSTSFVNRKVSIYKVFLDPDAPDTKIGNPVLIFSGIISSSRYQEDSEKDATIDWTLSSHWGDFQQVRGRLGVDEFHRALTTEGTADPRGTLKPEYAYDKGFQHGNTAVNIVAVYKVMETRYKMKKKKKSFFDPAGLFRKTKLKAYQVEVDRDVDLRFNLSAKYIPIVYGVRRLEGVPVFADTAFDKPSDLYLAEVLCEGPIQSIMNVFVDDNPLVCTDLADYNIRNSSGTTYKADSVDVACYGRADKGDILSGSSSIAAGNISNVTSSLAAGAAGNSWDESIANYIEDAASISDIRLLEGNFTYTNNVNLTSSVRNLANLSTANSTGGTGLTHEKGYTIESPVAATLEVKCGLGDQSASSLLVNQASGTGFKIHKDYYGNTSFENYWGPNHRLLDTAYVAQKIVLSSEQTTAPDLQYVVKGKLIKCYNYDGSFSKDPTRTSAAESLFTLGATVTLKKSADNTTIASNVTIIDKWYFYGEKGILNYRFRWNLTASQEKALLNAKAFYMESGVNQWFMVTHDYSVGTFAVAAQLRQQVSSVASNGGQLQVTTSSPLANISQLTDPAVSLVGRITAANSFDVPNLSVTNFYTPIGSTFLGVTSPTINNVVTLTGSTASGLTTNLGGDLHLDVNNKIVLSSAASATIDAYNGMTAKITKFFSDGTTDVIYREITDYEVGTNKVITVSPNLEPQQIPSTSDTVEILLDRNSQDYRATNNFAIMTLDFMTTNRGGASLEMSQIDLNSFLQAARICDTTSDITVRLNGTAAVQVGDVYSYSSNGFKWSGTVKSTPVTTNNDSYITFTNCVGKLTNKFNNWINRALGDVIWDYSTNSTYRITTAGVQTSVSDKAALLSAGNFQLTLLSGTGPSLINLKIDKGNPVTEYSLYDSDFVNFWKYLGWDSPDQRWVTAHQGNIEIDTSAPVYNNISELLSHFNGILTFEDGKYALYVETKRNYDKDLWWNFLNSTEGWKATNATISSQTDRLVFNATTTNSYLLKDSVSFYGGDNQIVRMKVKRTGGSTWTGTLDYASSNKSINGLNTKTISDSTILNEWVILTWNMNGISQWTTQDIYSLKISLGPGIADDFDIEWISVGSNTRVIEQEDIIGSITINDDGVSGSFNSLTANILDPQNNFNSRSVSFFNSNFLAEDRGVVKSTNFSLDGITNYYNARIAVEQILRRSRYGRTITFAMRPVGLSLTPGDLIRIIYPRFGWDIGKYFRVNNLNFNTDCLVQVTAEEYSDSMYVIESGKKSPYYIDTPSKRTPIVPGVPTNLVATSHPSTEELGQIRLTWTAPTDLAESGYYEIFTSRSLGNPTTPNASNAVKLAEVPYDVTQFIDTDIQGEVRDTKYYWIRSVNRVSIQTTDSSDLRDYYSDFTNPSTGTSITVSTDEAVGSVLGGSLLSNPMMNAATIKYDGTGYRPIGWFIKGTAETEVNYSNANRDSVIFLQNLAQNRPLEVISHAIQLQDNVSYDLGIVARRVGGSNQTVSVHRVEHNAQIEPQYLAFTSTAPVAGYYVDPEIKETTGISTLIGDITLTSSFTLFELPFTPAATSSIACIRIILDNDEGIEIDSIWLRASGAKTSLNLFDDTGILLTGIDVRNDQLVRQNLQFINPNASFDIPRYDGGALVYPAAGTYTTRPSAWYLSSADAENLRPAYYLPPLRDEVVFKNNTTVAGAAIRVNLETTYEFVALVRSNTATNCSVGLAVNELTAELSSGKKFISNVSNAEAGCQLASRSSTIVSSQSIGTTYTILSGTYSPRSTSTSPNTIWFSPTMVINTGQDVRVDWFGVRDKSTYGARAGSTLFDSTGAILNDIDIDNDAMVGTVLGGSLLSNPSLDYAVSATSPATFLRPVGWFIAGNSQNEIQYNDQPTPRDTVIITRNGANPLYFLSQYFLVDPTDQYELVIVAKSSINNTLIDVDVMEHTTPLSSGKFTMTNATLAGYGFVDAEVSASTGTSTTLGTINLLNTGFTAFTKTFTPLPTTKVANIVFTFNVNAESMEVDSIWLRSRNSITSASIEGSVLSNPTFQTARIGTSGVLRPVGWFIKGTAENEIAYSNAGRSSVKFTQNATAAASLEVISHMFRVNPGTKYNITIVAKATTSMSVTVGILERSTEFENNTIAFTNSAAIANEFRDAEIAVATGSVSTGMSSTSIALTNTFTAFNLVYTPSSNALLACFRFLLSDNQNIEISSFWMRDQSTLGATTGTSGNLRDEIGNYLRGIDVRNDLLVKQGLDFYNANASFDLARYDGGANVYPAGSPGLYTLKPANWFRPDNTTLPLSYAVDNDIVRLQGTARIAGSANIAHAFTKYQFIALVRKPTAGSASVNIDVYHTTSDIGQGAKYLSTVTTGEPGYSTAGNTVALQNLLTGTNNVSTNWQIISADYTPPSGTKWFSPSMSSNVEIEIDWFGVVELATYGAKAGLNLTGNIDELLQGTDIRNDLLVRQSLQFMNYNSSFDIPRYDGGGVAYPAAGSYTSRPAGWYQSNGTANKPTYFDTDRDEVVFYSGHSYSNSLIRVNPDSKYEFVVFLKAAAGNAYYKIGADEFDTDLLTTSGIKYIGASAIGEPVGVARTRLVQIIPTSGNGTLGTSYVTVTGTYTPTATAKWFSPSIEVVTNVSSNSVIVEWFGVRESATYGAELGVNLFDSADRVLANVDILNDKLVQRTLSFLNDNAGFNMFRSTGSGGSYLRHPANWFLSNNATTSNIPTYVDPNTLDEISVLANMRITSGAIRVNPGDKYEIAALVKAASGTMTANIYIEEWDTDALPSTALYIGPGTGESGGQTRTREFTSVTTAGIGTTYTLLKHASVLYKPTATAKWFSISFQANANAILDWFGVRSAATYGATTGANGTLFAENGVTPLLDIDVRNDQLVGSILGSSLTSNPTFDFARKNEAGTGVRPVGWFIRAGAESQLSYSNADRDTIDFNGSGAVLSIAFPISVERRYEVTIVARSDNNSVVNFVMCERNARFTDGTLAFTTLASGGFLDPGVAYAPTGTSSQTLAIPTLTGSMVAYGYEYKPAAGMVIACLNIVTDSFEHIELDSVWITEKMDMSLGDIGGSILGNPGLDIARPKDTYDPLKPVRPLGWYRYAIYENEIYYTDNTRDVLKIENNIASNSARLLSSPFRVNPKTKYELTVVARRVGTLAEIELGLIETTTVTPLSTGQATFIHAAAALPASFQDSYIKNSEGSLTAIGTITGLTTSMVAYTFDFTPTSTTKWGVISLVYRTQVGFQNPQSLEIDSIWLREKATDYAAPGDNLRDKTSSRILNDVDVRNDLVVKDALGGFLNPNAEFSAFRTDGTFTFPSGGNFALRPAAWFAGNTNVDAAKPYFIGGFTTEWDEVGVPASTLMCSAPIRVNRETRYEVIALVKSQSGTPSCSIYIEEYRQTLPVGTEYIGKQGVAPGPTGEGSGVASDSQLLGVTQTLSTTYATMTSVEYTPSATATWFSISIYCNAGPITLDWMGVRESATHGATHNDNIKGQPLITEDFAHGNSALLAEVWNESLANNSSGEITIVDDPAPSGASWKYALACGNNSAGGIVNDQVWRAVDRRRAVPIKKDKLYRISGWIKRVSGTGTAYLGVAGVKGDVYGGGGVWAAFDGTSTLNGQYYFAASAVAPASWTRYEGIFTRNTSTYKGTGGTANDPFRLHPDATHVVPLVVANISGAVGETRYAMIEIQELENFGAQLGSNLFSSGGSTMNDADVRNSEARIWNFPQGSAIIWNSYGTTATDYSPSSGSGTTHDQTITVEVKDALGNVIRTRTLIARVTFSSGNIDGSVANITTVDNITISSVSNNNSTGITWNLTDAVTGKTTKAYANTVSTTTGGVGK